MWISEITEVTELRVLSKIDYPGIQTFYNPILAHTHTTCYISYSSERSKAILLNFEFWQNLIFIIFRIVRQLCPKIWYLFSMFLKLLILCLGQLFFFYQQFLSTQSWTWEEKWNNASELHIKTQIQKCVQSSMQFYVH